MPAQIEIEFVKGIMTTSAAFITVTGIIFAVSLNKQYLDKISFALLMFSIVLGVASISTSLSWFNIPNNAGKSLANLFLIFQFITGFIPLFLMYLKGIKPKN